MYGFLKWLHLTALIIWMGEVVFFSFVVAPALFRTFPTADAGRAVAAIFPMYYRIGYVCGVILVFGSLLLRDAAATRLPWLINSLLATVMFAGTLYAGAIIQPRAAELRPQLHAADASPAVQEEFDRLHRLAVQLNGVVLLCGIAVTVVTARALRL